MLTFIYITWSVKNTESWTPPRLTELEYLDVMARNLCPSDSNAGGSAHTENQCHKECWLRSRKHSCKVAAETELI